MRNVTLVDFTDLLFHAQNEMGINWNKAHSMLDHQSNCCVLPYDGNGTKEIYLEDFYEETEGYKILQSFFNKHGLDSFVLTT